MAVLVSGTLSNSTVACTECFGPAETPSAWSTIERMQIDQLAGMLLLCGMLIALVALGIGSYRAISTAVKQSRSYESRALTALFYGRVREAMRVAAFFPKSPLAVVMAEAVKPDTNLEPLAQSRWALQRAIVSQAESLKRRLWTTS